MTQKNNLVLGITGTNSAGKDTVARFFKEEKNFNIYSHSDELRKIADKKGVPKTRDGLFNLGNNLRAEKGNGALSKIILKKIKKPAVILSIRHPDEIKVYKENLESFKMISVDAPPQERYKRSLQRGREGEENYSYEEFIKQEQRELEGSDEGQQILKVMSMSDIQIKNDSTIENLYNKLEEEYKNLLNN